MTSHPFSKWDKVKISMITLKKIGLLQYILAALFVVEGIGKNIPQWQREVLIEKLIKQLCLKPYSLFVNTGVQRFH